MFMRRRPLLRTAVVGGGAYVAGKKAGQRSAAATDQAAATAPAPTTAPADTAGAAAPPMLDQLNQLTTLHQQGSLTDGEFAAAKARLLGT